MLVACRRKRSGHAGWQKSESLLPTRRAGVLCEIAGHDVDAAADALRVAPADVRRCCRQAGNTGRLRLRALTTRWSAASAVSSTTGGRRMTVRARGSWKSMVSAPACAPGKCTLPGSLSGLACVPCSAPGARTSARQPAIAKASQPLRRKRSTPLARLETPNRLLPRARTLRLSGVRCRPSLHRPAGGDPALISPAPPVIDGSIRMRGTS